MSARPAMQAYRRTPGDFDGETDSDHKPSLPLFPLTQIAYDVIGAPNDKAHQRARAVSNEPRKANVRAGSGAALG